MTSPASTGSGLGFDFDDAVLGHGLPEEAQDALREAGLRRGEPPLAMAALMRAQRLAPEHPAVLIAFYRHYFYGHQLAAARDIARKALCIGAEQLGLPVVWRNVPERPLAGARFDPRTRFYLFVLKGYAYLSLRLNDAIEARDALAKLRALDPQDCVGGALLEAVRQRALRQAAGDEDEDADRGPALPAFGAAAWARVPAASTEGAP